MKTNEEISIEITSHLAGILPSDLYDRLEKDIIEVLDQKDDEGEDTYAKGFNAGMEAAEEQHTGRATI